MAPPKTHTTAFFQKYGVVALASLLISCSSAVSAPKRQQPVLLELYTSQGCSSCPSADRLLSKLGHDGKVDGVPVIPLAFHVDYWNYLGWSDPFSSEEWSKRQRRYGKILAKGRVYTPQLVVNGRDHVVGSRSKDVARSIAQSTSKERVAITAKQTLSPKEVAVEVALSGVAKDSDLSLSIALYENDVETKIPRGENAGRTVRNDYIVRALKTVPAAPKQKITFAISKNWKRKNLGVVAFLQDKKSLAVVGVVRAD